MVFNGTSAQKRYIVARIGEHSSEKFKNMSNKLKDEVRIRGFGKCVSAVHTNGKTVKTIDVKLSYSTIKTNFFDKSTMQRGVTWLNKSSKLVTVKWLLQGAHILYVCMVSASLGLALIRSELCINEMTNTTLSAHANGRIPRRDS